LDGRRFDDHLRFVAASRRSLLGGVLAAGGWVALFPASAKKRKRSCAKRCPTGCCTSEGRCVTSTRPAQCGRNGERCVTCGSGQLCQNGLCCTRNGAVVSTSPRRCCHGGDIISNSRCCRPIRKGCEPGERCCGGATCVGDRCCLARDKSGCLYDNDCCNAGVCVNGVCKKCKPDEVECPYACCVSGSTCTEAGGCIPP
jgi:hypothetical protein